MYYSIIVVLTSITDVLLLVLQFALIYFISRELLSADDRLRSVDFHERKTPTKQEPKMDHIFALLTTPVPSARKDKASYNAYGLHQKNESRHCHTPQSILKVKRILQNEDIAGSPSLPKSDECETDVEQVRFQLLIIERNF